MAGIRREVQGDTLIAWEQEEERLAMAENIYRGDMVVTVSGSVTSQELAEIFTDELMTLCTLKKKVYVDMDEVEQISRQGIDGLIHLYDCLETAAASPLIFINPSKEVYEMMQKNGLDYRFTIQKMDLYHLSGRGQAEKLARDVYQEMDQFIQEQMSSNAGKGQDISVPKSEESLEESLSGAGDTFQECLLHWIDVKKMTDVEVYKKADLNRQLFSKIRCNPAYVPKKKTAVALILVLELKQEEAADLLARAGLALSPSNKSDLIIQYCIRHGIYDLYTVNNLLYEYDQPVLGGS